LEDFNAPGQDGPARQDDMGRRIMPRVAIVTGGNRGIGGIVAEQLKEKGYRVAAIYGGNDEAAKKYNEENGIAVYKVDVSDFDACKNGIAQIESGLGPVEIMVNNAGITRDSTLHRMEQDSWQAVIDTNLGSCFNMCRCVIDGIRERKFGRIVNIGSINGQAGQYGQVNYAAAKSGIHGFTKALPRELPSTR
jgi:acetoacetyl-CoA reductase